MSKKPHIIVVGSGLAGLTCIAALAGIAERITLLERDTVEPSVEASQKDERPLSLSYSSVVFLKNLRLWDQIASYAAPIDTVHVSEQYRFGSLTLKAADVALDALGYVIPFYILQDALQQFVLAQAHVQREIILDLMRIDEDEHVSITFATATGQQMLRADYVIAADGVSSPCRRLLNIQAKETPQQDVALTAMLALTKPHQHIAYERFTPQGVLALLPMWDTHQYRLVWTLDTARHAVLSDAELVSQINSVFASRIGRVSGVKREGSYPLTTCIAQHSVTSHCVLIGDSAHRMYPLAAQGYNLTLRDCAQLVDVLAQGRPLSEYARLRAADQKVITHFTHSLEWVFGLQLPLFSSVRAAVLFKLDWLPLFKKQLILRLLGRAGPQPELLCED